VIVNLPVGANAFPRSSRASPWRPSIPQTSPSAPSQIPRGGELMPEVSRIGADADPRAITSGSILIASLLVGFPRMVDCVFVRGLEFEGNITAIPPPSAAARDGSRPPHARANPSVPQRASDRIADPVDYWKVLRDRGLARHEVDVQSCSKHSPARSVRRSKSSTRGPRSRSSSRSSRRRARRARLVRRKIAPAGPMM